MDPNYNSYSDYQNSFPSQAYYPNLDNIQNSEDFEISSNSQFPQHSTQNISQNSNQNAQQTQTNTSNRPKSWSVNEDVALMSSYCMISENPMIGTDQKDVAFWGSILELYRKCGAENPRLMLDVTRSAESLRNRYKRLNTNVTKWVGAYKEAYSQRKSGWSNTDIDDAAQVIYGKPKFTHQDVFDQVMRHHPKWELKLNEDRTRYRAEDEDNVDDDRGSSKKSKTGDEGGFPTDSTPETPLSDASTIFRPIGRDKTKAKAKRKGKGMASQSSFILDEFTSELRALRITREKEIETMTNLTNMKMISSLLNTLMGNSNLSPEEESLKFRLMAELFP